MGRLATIALALTLGWAPIAASQAPTQDNCASCHEAISDARLSDPVAKFRDDVHAAKGFGCVACHGGDATLDGVEAMDPAKGFVGKPSRRQIPNFCGRCHSNAEFMKRYNPSLRVDQEAEYATSVHGQRLAKVNDSRVATCINCHQVHATRPPSDPLSSVHPANVAKTCGSCHADAKYMEPYGIPTDQEQKYETSAHWEALSVRKDLSAPTCNDCHGNHGAAPPGISWVGNTCGQCHSVMAAAFQDSPHGKSFPSMGIPGCVACHNNHDIHPAGDELLGLDDKAVCSDCHQAGSKGGDDATAMRGLIDSLRTEIDSARTLLGFAANAGVEVSQAEFDLEGAHNALVSSRAAIHSFSLPVVDTAVAGGRKIAAAAMERGHRALRELRFRRTGLAVSMLIIVVLIGALVQKIRHLDRQPDSAGASH